MSQAKPRDEPAPSRSTPWEAIVLIGGGILLLAVAATWLRSSGDGRSEGLSIVDQAKAYAAESRSPFIGSKVCGECHPGEAAHYFQSGHARTLRPARTSKVVQKLDGRVISDPEQPGVTWKYSLKNGEFHAERSSKNGGEVERFVLEYALGSGHHATTFVAITDRNKPAAIEHRMTYFTENDTLEITPGQRAETKIPGTTWYGRALSERETLKCFGCHTTPALERLATSPGQAPVPEIAPQVANVSCEHCHGPAREHVLAARSGRAILSMPFGPERSTAASQLGLCGQCHRHPARFPANRIRSDDPQLARFQPIGLMQSKCYTQSAGRMSCVTCHDPHARASSDVAGYVSVCLSCHGGPAADGGKACPVSARDGCVNCHMPKRDSGQKIMFTDHWIRTRGAEEAAKPTTVPLAPID